MSSSSLSQRSHVLQLRRWEISCRPAARLTRVTEVVVSLVLWSWELCKRWLSPAFNFLNISLLALVDTAVEIYIAALTLKERLWKNASKRDALFQILNACLMFGTGNNSGHFASVETTAASRCPWPVRFCYAIAINGNSTFPCRQQGPVANDWYSATGP